MSLMDTSKGTALTSYDCIKQLPLYPLIEGLPLGAWKEMNPITSNTLWNSGGAVIMVVRRPGCIICREEATGLASLQPKLAELGVSLFAIIHEQKGCDDFRPYLGDAPLYLDPERKFFDAMGNRWMSYADLLRPTMWAKYNKAKSKGIKGNILEGEGRLLGGIFVIAPNDQGIVYEHREEVSGETAVLSDIMDAVYWMKANSHVVTPTTTSAH